MQLDLFMESNNVYKSDSSIIELPRFTANYPLDKIKTDWTFELIQGGSSSPLADLAAIRQAVADAEDGIEIKAICNASVAGNSKNTCKVYFSYFCKSDKKANYVEYEYNNIYDCFIALLYKDSTKTERAGGNTTYKWEIENEGAWEEISGQSAKYLKYKDEYLGKKIRVTFTQDYQGSASSGFFEKAWNDRITSASLEYKIDNDETINQGDTPQKSRINITSVSSKNNTATTDNVSVIFETDDDFTNPCYGSFYSEVIVSSENCIPYYTQIYIPVRSVVKDDEKPELVSNSLQLLKNHIKFEKNYSGFEYRINDEQEWTKCSSGLIAAKKDDVLHIRKAAEGTKGQNGWLKESEEFDIIVYEENVGKAVNAGGISVSKADVSIVKSFDSTTNKWTFTAQYSDSILILMNDNSIQVITDFEVDNPDADPSSIEKSDNKIVCDVSKWPQETFNVTLSVKVYYDSGYFPDSFFTTSESFKVTK